MQGEGVLGERGTRRRGYRKNKGADPPRGEVSVFLDP